MTNLYHSFFLSARRRFVSNQDWIWIGVNDINEDGKFVNMLNETVNYTNWAEDEPKNYVEFHQEIYKCDCVRIELGTGYFATPCSSYLMYALCSQRYDIGKYSDCQLKETGWLTNHPSNLSRQTISIFLIVNYYSLKKAEAEMTAN